MIVERGQIILIDLEPVKGSEHGRARPCLIIQNNIANKYSPTTIIAPITTSFAYKQYPTDVDIEPQESGLKQKSVVLCNQIRTISVKERAIKAIGFLSDEKMIHVNTAIKISLELD